MRKRIQEPTWFWWLPLAVGIVVLVVGLFGLGATDQRNLILIAVYTLVISGLNLSFGYGGELAFSQVAMLAAGAYTTAVLDVHGVSDMVLSIPASIVAAGVIGVVTGLPSARLSEWSLAIASFFLVLLIPDVVQIFSSQTGGLIGLSLTNPPSLFGLTLGLPGFLALSIGVTLVWLLIMRNQIVSRRGAGLVVMRESSQLAASLGLSVSRQRMYAYVMGSLPAGAAGALLVQMTGYISPTSFTLTIAIAILAGSVVGGVASVWGAPIGAVILVLGPLQSDALANYSLLAYGVFLVIVGVVFSSGLAGLAKLGWARLAGKLAADTGPENQAQTPAAPAGAAGTVEHQLSIPGKRLVVSGIEKSYGGLRALDGAGIVAAPGQVTAVMGANGAGKTTLLNVVSGFVDAQAGEIELGGERLRGLAPHVIARRGISRTFQTPIIPRDMTVLEVVETGRLTAGKIYLIEEILRLPRFRRARRTDRDAALAALHFAGLAHLAEEDANSLPLGTRRLLEVVRAVAREPKVMLLDEPAAGLDDVALRELEALIRRARDAGATIVIVEHNVPFLLGIADQVFVMDQGRVLASGTSDAVRDHPEVVATYLGRRAPVLAEAEG